MPSHPPRTISGLRANGIDLNEPTRRRQAFSGHILIMRILSAFPNDFSVVRVSFLQGLRLSYWMTPKVRGDLIRSSVKTGKNLRLMH